MKIALGQMYVKSGYCEENFNRMKTMVESAKSEGADLIVFPEMCISGSLLSDRFLNDEFCKYIHSFNEKIKDLSDGIGIIFGNLYFDELNGIKYANDGSKCRFNTALFAYDKNWVKKENEINDGIYLKHFNCDARINSQSRYFLSGYEVSSREFNDPSKLISPFIFNKDGNTYRIGLEVNDDLWNENYPLNISEIYKDMNCDFIVNISSNPWTIDKEEVNDVTVKALNITLNKQSLPVVYVNCCGMQNSGKNMLVFDGGSCVYNKDGERAYSLNDAFKEELGYYDFTNTNTFVSCENKLLEALTYAVAEVDKQMFGSRLKWIIGLSGGIDSSINAALLVKAIGSERIVGYNMASAYNSITTKNNARILAEGLGIEIREGSIELLNEASIKTMDMYEYKDTYGSLVYENIQARIRGHLLSTFASIEGGVIINNANKIEVALGYCTLYGDAIGAVAPLGDLTKVQCFQIARDLNAYFGKEVISNTLIPEVIGDDIKWDMPPSAELKEAQLDPMKWFYHDEIVKMITEQSNEGVEKLMESFLDGSIYETKLGKWIHYYHLEKGEDFIKDLEWLIRTQANAVFKRIQMPPIVLVSNGAFGSDYRESQLGFIQSAKYLELKEKIMNL